MSVEQVEALVNTAYLYVFKFITRIHKLLIYNDIFQFSPLTELVCIHTGVDQATSSGCNEQEATKEQETRRSVEPNVEGSTQTVASGLLRWP